MNHALIGHSKSYITWKQRAVAFMASLFVFAGVFFMGDTKEVKAAEVALSEKAVTMAPATTKTLKLNGAVAKKVKWSSNNKKVATVNKKGKVTARTKGTAKIKAAYNKKKYTCTVNVVYMTGTTSDGMRYKDAKGSFGHSGRWYKKNVNGKTYYYTSTDGSAIYFKATGSKYVEVSFMAQVAAAIPYFAYSVDGGKMKRQSVTKNRLNLGNAKTHYVRLVIDAMSEKEDRWAGEAGIGIGNITPVSSDGAVAAVKPENATIAFYGDSITQGIRVLNSKLTPAGASATNSFAWYCAAQLDLVPYYAGFGGSGIIQPGSFNNCINTILSNTAHRKAESYDADVIVIEHGTNDVYTYGEAFISEYKKVLNLLHQKHPKAKILAMIPFTQIHAEEIRAAAGAHPKWCTVVETSSWHLSYTDGLHPNKSGAKKAGLKLAKKVASVRKVTLY